MMISYIIPHKGRHGILLHHLNNLPKSPSMEVIVVDDNNEDMPDLSMYPVTVVRNPSTGVNKARNHGAEIAQGKYLLFVGSDCIPHHQIVLKHLENYLHGHKVVQGFSPFHHSVLGSGFMHFLDQSGIQANWSSLRDQDGNWAQSSLGYCLTTNFGIEKKLFELVGGFSEKFERPAWDDIEFGTRLRKYGIATRIEPSAVNFHLHQYTLEQYIRRQMMEGQNRHILCRTVPEMTDAVMNADKIKAARSFNLTTHYEAAMDSYRIRDMFAQLTAKTLEGASYLGVLTSIKQNPFLWYYEHSISGETSFIMSMMLKAMDEGNIPYVQHAIGWILDKDSSKHARKLAKEVFMWCGDTQLAAAFNEKDI